MKVVFIENDHLFSSQASKKLKLAGHDVITFDSIAGYKHEEADVYLIDLGLEALCYDLIKSIREKTDRPLVLYTNNTNSEQVIQAFDCGIDFYLPKLGNPNIFRKQIEVLGKHS